MESKGVSLQHLPRYLQTNRSGTTGLCSAGPAPRLTRSAATATHLSLRRYAGRTCCTVPLLDVSAARKQKVINRGVVFINQLNLPQTIIAGWKKIQSYFTQPLRLLAVLPGKSDTTECLFLCNKRIQIP